MEIEKALNRDAVSGAGDSGTSSRSFGTLLSWMSDRTTPVFVIGTSNDFTRLPPEFVRKGRFDDMFWLGLPTKAGLEQIFQVLLRRNGRDAKKFDVSKLATACEGWTGAEVEMLIQSTMFNCFASGKPDITTGLLMAEILETTPQSKINAKQYEEMESMAKNKLRPAATVSTEVKIMNDYRKIEI